MGCPATRPAAERCLSPCRMRRACPRGAGDIDGKTIAHPRLTDTFSGHAGLSGIRALHGSPPCCCRIRGGLGNGSRPLRFVVSPRRRIRSTGRSNHWLPAGLSMVAARAAAKGEQPRFGAGFEPATLVSLHDALPTELSTPDTGPRQIPCPVHTRLTIENA